MARKPKSPKSVDEPTPKEAALLDRYMRLSSRIEKIKGLYAEQDAITLALAELALGKRLKFKGYVIEAVDNFGEKNVSYRVAAVRRFELKVLRAT